MTKYSISVDDVDLQFLPLRRHRYNEFLKKEYFQFEIMKEDNVEEPAPTVFYTCHVCAIEVPAPFASEHVASIKHRANARIASVAMQRTRNLISSLPPPFSETIRAPSGRFCTNCAIVADENHNKTKDHRVAAMHDRLLWSLMTAYVGEIDDEELENDKDKPTEVRNGIYDHKRDEAGFENGDDNTALVSVANEDQLNILIKSINTNENTEDRDKNKINDCNTDIVLNGIDNKYSDAVPDVVVAYKNSKKPKKRKKKTKLSTFETTVSEVVNNESLQGKVLRKDEKLTEDETCKNVNTVTEQTGMYKERNNHILHTSRQQDVVISISGLYKLYRTKVQNSTRTDNRCPM